MNDRRPVNPYRKRLEDATATIRLDRVIAPGETLVVECPSKLFCMQAYWHPVAVIPWPHGAFLRAPGAAVCYVTDIRIDGEAQIAGSFLCVPTDAGQLLPVAWRSIDPRRGGIGVTVYAPHGVHFVADIACWTSPFEDTQIEEEA